MAKGCTLLIVLAGSPFGYYFGFAYLFIYFEELLDQKVDYGLGHSGPGVV